jgi:hypothetical protein
LAGIVKLCEGGFESLTHYGNHLKFKRFRFHERMDRHRRYLPAREHMVATERSAMLFILTALRAAAERCAAVRRVASVHFIHPLARCSAGPS